MIVLSGRGVGWFVGPGEEPVIQRSRGSGGHVHARLDKELGEVEHQRYPRAGELGQQLTFAGQARPYLPAPGARPYGTNW